MGSIGAWNENDLLTEKRLRESGKITGRAVAFIEGFLQFERKRNFDRLLALCNKAACPVDLVKEYVCEDAFGRFGKVARDEEPIDGNIGEIRKKHYNGEDYRPHKYTVKKECDTHSPAATEGEISRVGVSHKGQGDSRDHDHIGRQRADAFRGLVHHGEKGREAGKQESENRCAGN